MSKSFSGKPEESYIPASHSELINSLVSNYNEIYKSYSSLIDSLDSYYTLLKKAEGRYISPDSAYFISDTISSLFSDMERAKNLLDNITKSTNPLD